MLKTRAVIGNIPAYDETFLTDAELQVRWKCSKMRLWRLRDEGRLPKPIKLGKSDRSHNLTPLSAVRKLEAASANVDE
jgi:hypothetical protein